MYLYNQLQMITFLFVARKSRAFRRDEQEILQKQKMIDSYRRVGNPIWDLIQDFIQDFIQTGDVPKKSSFICLFSKHALSLYHN